MLLLAVEILLAPLALGVTVLILYGLGGLPLVALRVGLLFPIVGLIAGLAAYVLHIPDIKLNAYDSSGIVRTGWLALLTTCGAGLLVEFTPLHLSSVGVILFGLIFFVGSVAARFAIRHLLLWILRAGEPRRRVLIYGAGHTGIQLAAALRSHEQIVPAAFIDDNSSLQSMTAAGLRIHSPDQIRMLAENFDADRVILAMPSVSGPKLARIARQVQALGLKVMQVPSFAQLVGMEDLVSNLQHVRPDQFLGRNCVDGALPEGAEAYEGRTILVSGAGGSVGSELCRQLLVARPACLVLFEVSEVALYSIERELRDLAEDMPTRIVAVLGSATDSRMARMVMKAHEVDTVFHAAAYKHVTLVEDNPLAGLANNVLGTRTLGDAANEAGVRKFVLISTDKAVRPTNVMGASKRMAELVVQDLAKRSRGTVFSLVRFGNVLGSSGSVIPLFKDQIARGGPVTLTHEDVTRFFMTISEAARLVLLAGSYTDEKSLGAADVFVLDMGKPVRIADLARQMIEASGCTVRDKDHPDGDIEIAVTGLRPGEKLHEELLIGEGLLTTPHPKILRAHERALSELEMAAALRTLREAVASGDAEAARDVVRRYVEGYLPSVKLAARP
ncbi:MAG: polysaccharide biosynthesis protein [Pseudorhodobacter sp.]